MLECEVTGTAPFEVSWLKDNKEVRSSKKYTMTDKQSIFSLQIMNCDFQDAGEYQCIISNEGGSCSCSTRVSLKGQFRQHNREKNPHSIPLLLITSSNLSHHHSAFFLKHRATFLHQEDRKHPCRSERFCCISVHCGRFSTFNSLLDKR